MFLCNMKPILTITGSDSTSGSGMQADIKTISELGGYAMSAVTSITVQTTLGIQQFYDIPASIVSGQIDAVMNDFQPEVVKIGLIRNIDTLRVVINALRKYQPRYVIYDPVVLSSRGDTLVSRSLVEIIREELLPLCSYVVKVEEKAMHGMANRFASAMAFYLTRGETVAQARALALSYINTQVMKTSDLRGRSSELPDGRGRPFPHQPRRAFLCRPTEREQPLSGAGHAAHFGQVTQGHHRRVSGAWCGARTGQHRQDDSGNRLRLRFHVAGSFRQTLQESSGHQSHGIQKAII